MKQYTDMELIRQAGAAASERARVIALDAARAAVVEAAKAWRSEPSMSTKFGLMNALDALEKLERPDA